MVEPAQIIWTNEAREDLFRIIEYIAKESFQNANKISNFIFQSIEKLMRYPEMGSIVNIESTYRYRRILVKSFRIIYTYTDNKIYIVVIQHQKRQLPKQVDFVEKYI